MNIMNRLTWKSLWLNKTRTITTIIGITLSAALFMAVTTAAYSLWDFMVRGYEYESGDWFVSFDYATDQQYADAQADKAVKSVADLKIIGYTSQFDSISPNGTYEIGAMGENFLKQMSVSLVEGRLPENSREILIPEIYISLCKAGNFDVPKVGDTITLSLFFAWQTEDLNGKNPDVPEEIVDISYTVVGIMKNRNYRPNTGNWGFENMLTVADGRNVVNYYRYNPATGKAGSDILYSSTSFAPQIEIGAQLEKIPYGISTSGGSIIVVLPLSKLSREMENNYLVDLCMNAADYQTLLAELKEYGHGNIQFGFTDYNESQMNMRGIVKLLRVFSTGFIALISLIACANVLNTIATNVALRRKDYGMLRSMGFTQKHLYRMMAYECMNYGLRAILWSAPLSIGLCYGLYKVTNLSYSTDFAPPWNVFAIGLCLILAVMFASAAYAVFTIRKDNPIDAIRTETI